MHNQKLTIQTITPLWTGGVEGSMYRVHETGIIGSLRWWYEALLRGCGADVHNKVSDCSFDKDKFDKAAGLSKHEQLKAAGLCHACQVFGATGWRRRSALQVDVQNLKVETRITRDRQLIEYPCGREHSSWSFSPGKEGTMKLTFLGEAADLLRDLAIFVSRYAGLGARTQMGYGIVYTDPQDVWGSALKEEFNKVKGTNSYHDYPALTRCFFARLPLQPTQSDLKTLLAVKCALRQEFLQEGEEIMRHDLFGKVYIHDRPRGREDRYGSMVSMSRPYRTAEGVELRVWGWAPQKYCPGALQRIHDVLDRDWNLKEWIQFNSPLNDPAHAHLKDPVDFLEAL